MEAVKAFVKGHSTSKTSERRRLLRELCAAADSGELPPAAVRVSIHCIGHTLFIYSDYGSRSAVEEALDKLCSVYTAVAVPVLGVLVEEVCKYFSPPCSPSLSKPACTALRWSLVASRHGTETSRTLLQSQAVLLSATLPPSPRASSRLWRAAMKRLRSLWCSRPHLVEEYFSLLLSGEEEEESLASLCFLASLTDHRLRLGQLESQQQEALLDYYRKVVLASRTKPFQPIIASCAPLFKRITHDQFSRLLLSPVLKCLLRNPDELLEAIAHMISVLPLDCSKYAEAIMKNSIVYLSSTNPASRGHALQLVSSLAHQSSDLGPVEEMLEQLLTALKSSPVGKLTVAEHRCSVLEAIETLSSAPLSSSSQHALACRAINGLLGYLRQEVHAVSVVKGVGVMVTWCSVLGDEVPAALTEHLKSILSSKSSIPARATYLLCFLPLSQGERGAAITASFLPSLLQSLERASGKVVQATALEEGLVAVYVLVQTRPAAALPPQLWALVDSEQLLSPKLTATASQKTKLVLVSVAEKVLTSDVYQLKEAVQREWLLTVLGVSLSLPWSEQKTAAKSLTAIVISQPHTTTVMVEGLEAAVSQVGRWERGRESEFSVRAVLQVVWCLATPTHPHREQLALSLLLLLHHPHIVEACPSAWLSLLSRLELEPHPLVSKATDQILSLILVAMVTHPIRARHALRTVLCDGGEGCMVESVVGEVCRVMCAPEVVSVTSNDMEVMVTPPSQLWHPQLWKELSSSLEGGVSANMRRESKLYSFDDEKWDAEMKREMERRRRELEGEEGEGGKDIHQLIKEAKLSQKQREAILSQLEEEGSVRERLLCWDQQLSRVTQVVEEVGGAYLVGHTPRLSHAVLTGLLSPLAKSYCCRVWSVLVKGVIGEWGLSQLFAVSSLSLLQSPSSPPPPALPRLLDALLVYRPPSPLLLQALHSLSLPLLTALLVGKKAEELKEKAVAVLCKAISWYADSSSVAVTAEEAMSTMFPEAETLGLLSTLIASAEDTGQSMRMKKSSIQAFISLCRSFPHLSSSSLSLLTSSLSHPSSLLRETVLKALSEMNPDLLEPHPPLVVALLVARHDAEEGNKGLAGTLWESSGYTISLDLSPLLLHLASSSPLTLQSPTAQALGVWLSEHPHQASRLLEQLLVSYNEKKLPPIPKEDSFGRAVNVAFSDPWESRVGVAKALEQLPPHLSLEETMSLLKFIIPDALSDTSSEVQTALVSTAKAAIGSHGDGLAGQLMAHCEQCLQSAPNTSEADVIRQSIVVLMGTLAKHMDRQNPKVKAVVHLLLSNLDTPSQQVQESIAACLPPLVSVVKSDAESIIAKLLDKLLDSPSYSQRRGAAYGLAGLVKGWGIPTLKQHRVMQSLQDAVKNKKNYRHREGALFAFECLCDLLGRLFEPYVVHLLPDLLLCFGDGNQYVREATDRAARVIMAHLSSHGVKLILPSLLTALNEDSWRTKAGSAELLGAMAFCAPKQLSSCLPSIVPRLMEVLADSHSKVQNAGNTALRQIGSVIKNPEIQVLVPILLEALTDPSSKAQCSLQALLDTEFVHVIDPPSLALIMPTLKRTLELRSTESKKMAAQIIGNMYSLTDKKDLAPYLPDVLPGLKSSLVDPVPEVRSACAKALGAMVRGMGDEILRELLSWLLNTLQSDSSSVDRSGAAQGLSEVLLAQGIGRLSQLMPRFIESIQDVANSTHVRDGYLMLFVYLPITFGAEFTPFVADILPCILKGLADESEFIRDTSLLAGQTIVNRYADTAVELFLPELERGLFDINWRIRCSSIQLLGDLLYKISGLSGKMSTESEEDDNFGTEEARMAILRGLGEETRNRVLAGLFMGRSDVALMVRQAALHVWKVVVTHTARSLREILPTLVGLLLTCLASENSDKRKVAARTLGDLVRKLGERVLPEVIPMLERGLGSTDTKERQGVCIGLSEIIQQTSRDHILLYVGSLLPTVRSSLCDAEEEVRAAAAQTFNSLHNTVGPRILDEVLTPLLNDLSSPSQRSEVALDGLKQVMAVKSRVVLPHIVPQLVKPPVNARALALLSSVAGEALYSHLHKIIPALISSLEGEGGEVDQESWEAAEGVVLSVKVEPGPATLIEELVAAAKQPSPHTRAAAMGLLQTMCAKSPVDLNEHVPRLIIFTTESLNDPSDPVCEKAWLALEALVKRVNAKELPHNTGYLRKALKTVSAGLMGEELRGFALKGIIPCLTILKEGLISGSPDEKEESARVLITVIHLSSSKTLSTGKTMMLIAGPLIRVLGDRYGWNVKVATLEALVELVRKVGSAAKSFIPQLQTSYLKALNDPNQPVRVQAVTGLTELVPLSMRVDPVFNELHNGVKKNEDPGLRLTMLQALQGVLGSGGSKMSEKHKPDILATLLTLFSTAQEGSRLQAAQCVGALCPYLSDPQLRGLLCDTLMETDGATDWSLLQARAVALTATVGAAGQRLRGLGVEEEVVRAAVKFASSDRIPVCVNGLQTVGSCINHFDRDVPSVLPVLSQALTHNSTDVRIAVCDVCGALKRCPDPLLKTLLPLLLNNTREKNTGVRAAAESAIVDLVFDEQGLRHCKSLLDGAVAKQLGDTFAKLRAKQDI